MAGLDSLLRHLRRTPEPMKRRLRPILVQGVRVLCAIPGSRLASRVLRRVSPGLSAWLTRRYDYYVHAGLARPRAASFTMNHADADTRMVAQWLSRGTAGNSAPR